MCAIYLYYDCLLHTLFTESDEHFPLCLISHLFVCYLRVTIMPVIMLTMTGFFEEKTTACYSAHQTIAQAQQRPLRTYLRVGSSADTGAWYQYTIMKIGFNPHAPKKFEHTCVPKSNLVLPSTPFHLYFLLTVSNCHEKNTKIPSNLCTNDILAPHSSFSSHPNLLSLGPAPSAPHHHISSSSSRWKQSRHRRSFEEALQHSILPRLFSRLASDYVPRPSRPREHSGGANQASRAQQHARQRLTTTRIHINNG